VNSPNAKIIFKLEVILKVVVLSMAYLANRVVKTKRKPITIHVFSKRTKESPPTSFIVPANTGRLTFIATFDNTFKTAMNTFLVVAWI
jgi:hypothetical protein